MTLSIPSNLRVAVLKPDHGITGGFELLTNRVETVLRREGHRVERLTVPVGPRPLIEGQSTETRNLLRLAPDYCAYLADIEAFEQLDTSGYDLVMSTQPPSFAHAHPRHLSLFFHHQRNFYDLEDLWVEGGFAPDAELHRHAGRRLRQLDQTRLERVSWFAAGSATVRSRLARFNGRDNVSLFQSGLIFGPDPIQGPTVGIERTGAVLCVGRAEFPKRIELFVSAMLRLEAAAAVIGTGGRQAWAQAWEGHLIDNPTALDDLDEKSIWAMNHTATAPKSRGRRRIEWCGRVDDKELAHRYHEAPCVVAPALDEDYGLTAIEAMAHGTPVIVCRDGGGLAELVEHEVSGLIVEPTGAAIASAVDRIVSDRELRLRLSAGARRRAAQFTWKRAAEQLRIAIALTMDSEIRATG